MAKILLRVKNNRVRIIQNNRILATPLHIAAENGYTEIVALLLKYRANLAAEYDENESVLYSSLSL